MADREDERPRHLGRRHRQSNLSCFTKGVMGYRTPNIDRIANDACSLRNTTPSARPAMIKQRQAALR